MNNRQFRRTNSRTGSVLLVVVGLSVLLLTSFVVVMRIVRVDAQVGAQVEREAQARIMLPAALSFILETARLGQNFDGEAFGWTDVRVPFDPSNPSASWGPKANASTTLTAGTWPGPDSHYRADMHAWTRPPFATEGRTVYNPIQLDPSYLKEYELTTDKVNSQLGKILQPSYDPADEPADPITDLGYIPYIKDDLLIAADYSVTTDLNAPYKFSDAKWLREKDVGDFQPPVLTSEGLRYHWTRVWTSMARGYYAGDLPFHYNLLPQAQANTRADFVSGNSSPLAGTQRRAWFRVYREPANMHDGVPNNASGDYYDRIPILGENVFIITCGAGPTKGYKDWAEVVAAGESAAFRNEDFFNMLRSRERIMWYRAEWSPSTGDNWDARAILNRRGIGQRQSVDSIDDGGKQSGISIITNTPHADSHGIFFETSGVMKPQSLNVTGSIAWIQRLDREPPKW